MNSQSNKIVQKGDNHIAYQNSIINIYQNSAKEELDKLFKEGKYKELAFKFKDIYSILEKNHPYYPDYIYKPIEVGSSVIFEHRPTSKEAYEKYPLEYKGRFRISNDLLSKHGDFDKLMDEAYLNQESIKIDMVSMEAWLGGKFVETPNIDVAVEEGEWFIIPEKMPDPIPLSICVTNNDQEFFRINYLEMIPIKRNNDYVILSNRGQDGCNLFIDIELVISNKKLNKTKLNFRMNPKYQNTVKAKYELLNFLYVTCNSSLVELTNLKTNTSFLQSEGFRVSANKDKVYEEFFFVKRLLEIESYFDIVFELPEKSTKEDIDSIKILESFIKSKSIKKVLKNLKVLVDTKEQLKNIIDIFQDGNEKGIRVLSTGDDPRIELFDATIKIDKVITIYKSLIVDNIDRLKKKLETFEDGETASITLLPGSDPEYEVTYYLIK